VVLVSLGTPIFARRVVCLLRETGCRNNDREAEILKEGRKVSFVGISVPPACQRYSAAVDKLILLSLASRKNNICMVLT